MYFFLNVYIRANEQWNTCAGDRVLTCIRVRARMVLKSAWLSESFEPNFLLSRRVLLILHFIFNILTQILIISKFLEFWHLQHHSMKTQFQYIQTFDRFWFVFALWMCPYRKPFFLVYGKIKQNFKNLKKTTKNLLI